MTDRHGIGRKMEREAMHYAWATKAWRAFWQPGRSKFQAQDIWNLWDFLCLDSKGVIVAVQVCQDRPCWIAAREKAINEFLDLYNPNLMSFIMAYHRNKDGSVTWRTI
jgi:hypothetical protein